ncbi:alpha/beta hydrolase [Phaeobacter inhibens]|uniref:alpha/beta hydrolase n=1 Tax=Phaeobacter inhibens TaxID=221822 RepID=UPI0021A275C9|nr:alpha/beta hydrolase [Phaeobacter inhibens]UWR91709.1 alpha/beta hydrolase [Phaeobacter inhibens]
MISRRTALTGALAGSAILLGREAFAAPPERILFVHGRAQGGRAPDEVRAEWMAAFRAGLSKAGVKNPDGIDIQLPFYGDALDEITAQFGLPLASKINTRGDALQDEFLIFQEEVANEMRQGAGITDDQIDAEYGDNPREKGPLNWEWVQAIVRAIDRNATGLSQRAIEVFLRDVFLYVSRPGVQRAIDGIVNAGLDDRPTVVVGHSLGSVVAFNILSQRSDTRVPLFVTLGSPLGIRAIRRRFTPLKFPQGVSGWFNAFDPRDIVALYPLDAANFDVLPAVENAADIDNQTDNRHGISGYLDKARIASRVVNGV